MLILIVILPLLGFLSGGVLGRVLGRGVCYITTCTTFLSFFISTILFYDVLSTGNTYKVILGCWIFVDSLVIQWSFCFDSLTSIMLLVVTFISTLVHLYSTEYMEQDPHLPRFMSYLSLFTFFMLILVTANNFLQMFIGWEGVGLSSYLLINFWFTRIQANKAAIKAMLINRIGDFALLIAIFSIFFIFNSLDYDIVFTLVPLATNYTIHFLGYRVPVIDLICLLLFIGAMGKSAQLGLHTWLPDAMEGPTPVSALIHAATMVTAGVFLLSRCSFLFEFSPSVLSIVTVIGATTALFAATTGLFQNDMKKVIAYSTCSQLGYMIFACGLSSYEVGIFHLSNHAFFKALLFLGAGSIIHAVGDEQDMRKMGGLRKLLPFSYGITLIGSLALMGFPFLAGFYSKDAILEIAFSKYSAIGLYAYMLGTLAAFCTAFYSIRLLYLVFLSEPNGNRVSLLNAHEGGWKMTFPLFLLSILSIFIGYFSQDFFIGFGTAFWGSSLFVLPQNYSLSDIEFLDIFFKLLPFFFTLFGLFLSFFIYTFWLTSFFKLKRSKNFKNAYSFFNKKWYFDRIYNQFVSQEVLLLSHAYSYKDVDRGVVEILGPFGIIHVINSNIQEIKGLQSGYISHYLFLFILGILFLIFITLFFNTLFSLDLVLFFFVIILFFSEDF